MGRCLQQFISLLNSQQDRVIRIQIGPRNAPIRIPSRDSQMALGGGNEP
jgi:hypothetical protein